MHRPHPADLPAQPEKTPRLTQSGRLTAAALLLLCADAFAGQSAYTRTDADGQVHFGDRPPQDSYRKLKRRGVPIILARDQRMDGYSEDRLSALLRNAGHPL